MLHILHVLTCPVLVVSPSGLAGLLLVYISGNGNLASSCSGHCYILGWPESPLSFFHKIKDTFFIF